MSIVFGASMIGYLLFLVIAFFCSVFFLSSFNWYADDPIYNFLQLIAGLLPILVPLIVFFGFVLIFSICWLKSLKYIEIIINAIKELYEDNDNYIVLGNDMYEIEEIMNDLKKELTYNKRKAAENERRKNDLVVYLAHDLKTPLTSTIGYLSLVKEEKELPENLKEKYVDIAYNKAVRLESLIEEFFEITRFNFAQLALDKSTFNLNIMLEQILFEFKPLMLEKNMDYEFIAEQSVDIIADSNKLQRSFDNLLRNAINYGYENTLIKVHLAIQEQIIITFENRGPTIAAQKLDKIFEQFYRLDSARQTNTGGSGLGLAITKEIIEIHGGTIKAQSSDETIKFIIMLPKP